MENPPKTQVVERLREAQNILVTISADPSVDQLSAIIGFTLLMNKLGKHATAVFSGKVPSTLEFLKPEETIEQNTESLRDFIIALDKSKADKLRYKVEENVVKIFITPYRTSLSEKDLDFSQGDYNVDVVVALGVDERDHIDQAIIAHGRILHDATVIGIMAGPTNVDVGSINWQDPNASSLCEMLVSISESFQSGLLDGQMATAFLTGIVAETDRFSNDKTTSKVMTMAAQLMAAGANQQLIASELKPPQEPVVQEGELPVPKEEEEPSAQEGEIKIHEEPKPEPPVEEILHIDPDQISIDKHGTYKNAEDILAELESKKKEKEESYSKYVENPPTDGGTLTANAQPESLDPSVDPLSVMPKEPIPEFSEHAKKIDPPVSEAESEEPVDDTPLGPNVHNNDTLEKIEQKVEQFEAPGDSLDMPKPSEDEARQAVDNVVELAGDFNENRPDPIQALNAQPFIPEVDELHPPTVPPPLPPTLPTSDEAPSEDSNEPKDNGNDLPPLPSFSNN
jgi:hypothetical protein